MLPTSVRNEQEEGKWHISVIIKTGPSSQTSKFHRAPAAPRPHCAVVRWVGTFFEQTGPVGALGGAVESIYISRILLVSLAISYLHHALLWGEQAAKAGEGGKPNITARGGGLGLPEAKGGRWEVGSRCAPHPTSLPCSLVHQSQCVPLEPSETPAVTRPHSVYFLTKQFGCVQKEDTDPVFLLCHPG